MALQLPDPTTHGALYNRKPPVVSRKLQYFLTDFIRLRDWRKLDAFIRKGTAVRSWFEARTSWRLVLSGSCVGDGVCVDDHGRQVLNVWSVQRDDLDLIPLGLRRLMHWKTEAQLAAGNVFGELLDLVEAENHFITTAEMRRALPPRLDPRLVRPGWTYVYVYVEYWAPYGTELSLGDAFSEASSPGNIAEFDAPWQFIANVRALSGRVNTFCQYWLRPVPIGFDVPQMTQTVQREITRAGWHRTKYRPMRVDLLTPTGYDPLTLPREGASHK
jgi:hypothetical protein